VWAGRPGRIAGWLPGHFILFGWAFLITMKCCDCPQACTWCIDLLGGWSRPNQVKSVKKTVISIAMAFIPSPLYLVLVTVLRLRLVLATIWPLNVLSENRSILNWQGGPCDHLTKCHIIEKFVGLMSRGPSVWVER
jgi:hypothetical protein